MCSFPTFSTKEWNFEAKKKLNSTSQRPYLHSFSEKLIYKGKSRLKELYKISRCFRSHIVSLHESSWSIPGNSLQNTRWSSYWCQGLIESTALAVKVKTQRRIIEPSSYKQVIPLSLKRQLNQLKVARRLNSLTEGQSELQYSKVN